MTRETTVSYPCAACGAVNRFAARRAAQDPRCGRCRAPVFPRAPVPVDEAGWSRRVEGSPLPVLVDFWAPWCAPCRLVAPVLEAVAAERAGRLVVAKVNVDRNPRLAARHGVRGIPTLLVLDRGRPLEQTTGAHSKEGLDLFLDRALAIAGSGDEAIAGA